MSADEFDRKKTGRFQIPQPPSSEPALEEEDTQTREHPAAAAPPPDAEDPAFDKRKTQIFRRPELPPTTPDDTEEEQEHSTGEYERVKTGRYHRGDFEAE